MGKFNDVAAAGHYLAQVLEILAATNADIDKFNADAAMKLALHECRPFVRLLRTDPAAKLPSKGSTDAVGYDVTSVKEYTLQPGERVLVDTGWKIAVCAGFEVQVRPRSGLALKHGVTVVNTPGTVDPDYRGGLGVILINHGTTPFQINVGDRVAQLVVAPVTDAEMTEVASFDDTTARGEGGYGSTGVK